MLHIVLVEDDYLDADQTQCLLQKILPDIDVRIEWIDTESTFRQWLAGLVGRPPNLVILDARLPWTRPAPIMPSVPDGYAGKDEAGLRCYELLRKHTACENVPVILLTHATVTTLQGALIVPKGERSTRLSDIVRQILAT